MAEEFTINSSAIESKINQLLPSQGGFAPGVDFSASTMVIPIVDLTETAEGSSLRQDLQKSFGHGNITAFAEVNTTNVSIINTTGYWKVIYSYNPQAAGFANWILTDGVTPKILIGHQSNTGNVPVVNSFDIFLAAGDSLLLTTSTSGAITGSTRQIADLAGNLVDPS